jgi:hypothetical protein
MIGLDHLHFDVRAEPLPYLNWSYISTTPFPFPVAPDRQTPRPSVPDTRLRNNKTRSVPVCIADCPLRLQVMDTSVVSVIETPSVWEVEPRVGLGLPVSVPAKLFRLSGIPTEVRAPFAIAPSEGTSVSAPGVVIPPIDALDALDKVVMRPAHVFNQPCIFPELQSCFLAYLILTNMPFLCANDTSSLLFSDPSCPAVTEFPNDKRDLVKLGCIGNEHTSRF